MEVLTKGIEHIVIEIFNEIIEEKFQNLGGKF
jgi:hypothetical protein